MISECGMFFFMEQEKGHIAKAPITTAPPSVAAANSPLTAAKPAGQMPNTQQKTKITNTYDYANGVPSGSDIIMDKGIITAVMPVSTDPPSAKIPQSVPLVKSAFYAAQITIGILAQCNGKGTMLLESYTKKQLSNADVIKAMTESAKRIYGWELHNAGMVSIQIQTEVNRTIHLIEKQFILNDKLFSLDLLRNGKGDEYKNFVWNWWDFPGGKDKSQIGPNEDKAKQLATDLKVIRPERRANTDKDAVLLQSEFLKNVDLYKEYIVKQWVKVPNFKPNALGAKQENSCKLNEFALSSFLLMRDDALEDGVALIIGNSHRSFETAKENAGKAGNSNAVASYSSHSLGIAIDFDMSYSQHDEAGKKQKSNFSIQSTTSFQYVVNMRRTPAHKWLMIYGAKYGWYPYQNETWHFEFNPPGFKERYFGDLAALIASKSGKSSPIVPTKK